MKRITEQEYRNAISIIREYEKQLKDDKLSIYKNCTENDILYNKTKDYRNDIIHAYWVSKDKEIPDRDPDCIIRYNYLFYTMDGSNKPYDSLDDAKKAMLKNFKRKKFII